MPYQKPHTQPGNQPPRVQIPQPLRARLQRAADEEDDGADEHRLLAAEPVTAGPGQPGADEGAAREDGHHRAFLRIRRLEEILEVDGGDDAGDDAEIVAEERRAEGGEEADQELVPLGRERCGSGLVSVRDLRRLAWSGEVKPTYPSRQTASSYSARSIPRSTELQRYPVRIQLRQEEDATTATTPGAPCGRAWPFISQPVSASELLPPAWFVYQSIQAPARRPPHASIHPRLHAATPA